MVINKNDGFCFLIIKIKNFLFLEIYIKLL